MSSSKAESTPEHKLPKYTPRKLRLLRKRELGLSQEELAEKAACDARTVQRYEKGESPIPPEFIRRVELLRVEERGKRARELGVDEIDFNNVSLPGQELIELIPKVHVRELLGKLTPIFVAVPKEWLDPSAEGGLPPPSPAPASGPGPSGHPTHAATSVTRAEFRMGLACVCVVMLGAVAMLRSELRTALSSARSLHVARNAKVERPTAQRAPETMGGLEPDKLPDETCSDGASSGSEDGAGLKRIQMPKKPYSWQKHGPCGQGEVERIDACWLKVEGMVAPCSDMAVESEGRCFVPVRAKPAKPNTVEPNK